MANQTSTKTDLLGAWTTWNFTPTAAAKKVFSICPAGLIGVKYYDLIAFREQIVNGTNYRFICAAETMSGSDATYLVEVEVYQPISGDPHAVWIHEIGPVPTGLMGGWQNWKFPASVQAANALKAAQMMGSTFTPYGSTSQLVAGTNYCLICEQKVLTSGIPGIFASLVYVYQDLSGKSHITSIQHID